ncbi:hypothetical protein Acr_26g0002210 [Actinidia rufa]|uniref:Uncharacterized protein n=1 Tax=Actinidia rufa TaxID=165716 RepID=A0A7J0H1T8_9ERIC|nr:hypothetical protein Acr_26g0002210 [Actinidia rufa]
MGGLAIIDSKTQSLHYHNNKGFLQLHLLHSLSLHLIPAASSSSSSTSSPSPVSSLDAPPPPLPPAATWWWPQFCFCPDFHENGGFSEEFEILCERRRWCVLLHFFRPLRRPHGGGHSFDINFSRLYFCPDFHENVGFSGEFEISYVREEDGSVREEDGAVSRLHVGYTSSGRRYGVHMVATVLTLIFQGSVSVLIFHEIGEFSGEFEIL